LKMASLPQTETHCDTAKARRQLRRKEYKLLHRIQRNLERQYKTPILDDDQLAEVGIIRGALFDIDTHDVLDFDSRYFLVGPADDVDRGMELTRQTTLLRENIEWRCHEPIEYHSFRNADGSLLECEAQATARNAEFRDIFCCNNTGQISGWVNHWYRITTPFPQINTNNCCGSFASRSKAPFFRQSWESPHNGKPEAHVFYSGHFFMWPNGPEPRQQWERNPNVPHAMATVYDSRVPRDGGLLRSELLMAIRLIKTQFSDLHIYLDHRVCPVRNGLRFLCLASSFLTTFQILVVSFHGRFSARLVQACVENGRFIVRPSRLLNMHVATITHDVRLALQWLNCRPVGDTRFPTKKNETFDKEGGVEGIRVGLSQIKCEQLA
jgi:hypothetical protein